ncbi:oxidoreductase-like domain-containing protein [Undibacterium terreum]|uniref:Oxidoreductase-like domain-containing protein n=1 Tax=Undibacterium terreum TaxID=1224302 RepID=A0A916XEP1_9BURK|nr:oxidoreductase-like domain-containing protein [Undibacterium terreum]GGC68381.1 hypothetical protein GCM10011396_14260 [Undibacterium terreum]
MPSAPKSENKPPVPPRQPELEECCGSGCVPCIFDIYEDAMERYRKELQAWEAGKTKKRGKKASASGKA